MFKKLLRRSIAILVILTLVMVPIAATAVQGTGAAPTANTWEQLRTLLRNTAVTEIVITENITAPTGTSGANDGRVIDVASPAAGQTRTVTLRTDGEQRNITIGRDNLHFTVGARTTLVIEENVHIVGRRTADSGTGSAGNNGGGIRVNDGGRLVLDGGVIRQVMGNSAVDVQNGGTFVINSGEIRGNRAGSGAGVTVSGSRAFFEMTGGRIHNNHATSTSDTTAILGSGGGGVRVASSAIFEMTGGEITNNTAARRAGGVLLIDRVTFNFRGGTISNNGVMMATSGIGAGSFTYRTGGGGIYATNRVVINMFDGASVTGNRATSMGGGIALDQAASAESLTSGSTLNMFGGVISDNHASVPVNGVNAWHGDGVHIAARGGGIYARYSFVNVNAGTISRNTAPMGGGIGTFNAVVVLGTPGSDEGPLLDGNEAFGHRRGSGNTLAAGPSYESHSGGGGGGAIYIYGWSYLNYGRLGGGLLQGCRVRLTMHGGTISNNTAPRGGGILMNEGTFNMFGGTITANTATDSSNLSLAGYGPGFTRGHNFYNSRSVVGGLGGGVLLLVHFEHYRPLLREPTRLNMSGGEISHNEAQNGGGIARALTVRRDANRVITAIINITGGAITNNTARQDGGGIFTRGIGDYTGGLVFTHPNPNVNLTNAQIRQGRHLLAVGPDVVFYGNEAREGSFALLDSTVGNLTMSGSGNYTGRYLSGNISWSGTVSWSGANSVGGVQGAPGALHLFNNHDINNGAVGVPSLRLAILTVDQNGGEGATVNSVLNTAPVALRTGSTVTLGDSTLPGYRFDWEFRNTDTGELLVDFIYEIGLDYTTFTMPDHNVTATAIWEHDPSQWSTIRFATSDPDLGDFLIGGQRVEEVTFTGLLGSEVNFIPPMVASAPRYRFDRWSDELPLTFPEENVTITIYAYWVYHIIDLNITWSGTGTVFFNVNTGPWQLAAYGTNGTINILDIVAIHATPGMGYHFVTGSHSVRTDLVTNTRYIQVPFVPLPGFGTSLYAEPLTQSEPPAEPEPITEPLPEICEAYTIPEYEEALPEEPYEPCE